MREIVASDVLAGKVAELREAAAEAYSFFAVLPTAGGAPLRTDETLHTPMSVRACLYQPRFVRPARAPRRLRAPAARADAAIENRVSAQGLLLGGKDALMAAADGLRARRRDAPASGLRWARPTLRRHRHCPALYVVVTAIFFSG
jgi:hypothetical protein